MIVSTNCNTIPIINFNNDASTMCLAFNLALSARLTLSVVPWVWTKQDELTNTLFISHFHLLLTSRNSSKQSLRTIVVWCNFLFLTKCQSKVSIKLARLYTREWNKTHLMHSQLYSNTSSPSPSRMYSISAFIQANITLGYFLSPPIPHLLHKNLMKATAWFVCNAVCMYAAPIQISQCLISNVQDCCWGSKWKGHPRWK